MDKKKTGIIVAVGAGIVLIAGGAGAAYWHSQMLSPEAVVATAMNNIAAVKTYKQDSVLKLNIYSTDLNNLSASGMMMDDAMAATTASTTPEHAEVTVTTQSVSDISNTSSIKMNSVFNVNADAGDNKLALGAEIRVVGKTFYAQLTNAPTLGFFSLKPLENQWVKIDPTALAKQFGDSDVETKLAAVQASPQFTVEQKEQLKQAFFESGVATITSKLTSESLDGQSMYHYGYLIHKENLRSFVQKVNAIVQKDAPLTEEDWKQFEETISKIEQPAGEIWIGKKDLLPHRLMIAVKSITKEGQNNSGSGVMTINMKDFNAPVTVEAPASSKNIEDLVSEYLGGAMFGADMSDTNNVDMMSPIDSKSMQMMDNNKLK